MKHWDDAKLAERIERWENVERVLKALTPYQRRREWDMQNWGVKSQCRTIACAAGHCGMDPWFRRRGMKLNPYKVTKGETLKEVAEVGGMGDFGNMMDPEPFLGEDGCNRIFFDSTRRPVSA